MGVVPVSYALLVCRATLAAVFVVSLVSKVRNRDAYDEFEASVAVLRVIPRGLVKTAAVGTILAETATVVLLLIPGTIVAGFAVAAGLLVVLTTAILIALRKGRRAPCRCFGASTTPLGAPHVVRNLVLLAVCLAGASAWPQVAPTFGDVAISLVIATVLVLFVVRMDDVIALFATSPHSR